ncbi:MAG: precorrin-6A reductase [Oscillospiraceae bacterium]|nr:precorrin-6A reductase [Oscillospiraceae bacterium]
MSSILLFAGTTEGRRIAQGCRNKPVTLHVSVATEYGETLIEPADNIHVVHGRKDAAEIGAMIDETGASLVIDATHPYAEEVTRTLHEVCASKGIEYLRVLRDQEKIYPEICEFVDDTDAAIDYLQKVHGNVLLTVGSKELARYTEIEDYQTRLFARILSLPEAMKQASDLGFGGKNLICMQGPFSEELNIAMMRSLNIRYLVTKDTGSTGGFPEKIRAAKVCGVTPVVIRRPLSEAGVGVEECLSLIGERYGFTPEFDKHITILGVGTGSAEGMTLAAEQACREADLIIGAKRLCESLERFRKPVTVAIAAKDIDELIRSTPARNIVVAMSGDTGFYSGTKSLLARIADLHPNVLPGISSVAYLSSRTGVSWDDAVLVSAHGRSCNIVAKVRDNPKVIALVGGADGVSGMAKELTEYGLGGVQITVGENLSYENERITSGTADELRDQTFDSLSLVLVQNPEASKAVVTHGREDDDFTRTEVPMTKQEVRAVTLAKLRLTKDAVCWDIGAGTGSVSLEMAECCVDGHVWAVEQKEDACELIETNKRKLRVANVTVVCGKAPDCLADLPAPTHIFVGGSSGNLRAILEAALEKNPSVRIVINAITLETVAEAAEAMKELPVVDTDIIQLSAARGRKLGRYHLMTGMNPVFILSCEGGPTDA